MACPTAPGRTRELMQERPQRPGNRGGDQHLPNLVALADDFELRFAVVAAYHLAPRQADKLGDGPDQHANLQLAHDALRHLAGRLLSLISGPALKRV